MSQEWLDLRRIARRAMRRLRGAAPIPFVHHRRYRTWMSGTPMDALRAERILAFLFDEGWLRPDDVREGGPAAEEDLRRVHTPEYLRSLEDPEVVARVLGVPVRAEEARAAVQLQRLAAGGTILASELAIDRRGPAVHLGGGLHHAAPAEGMGFCLLNDVAIAIERVRRAGFRARVAVIDLDLHDGNGTRAAFAGDPEVHTFSIHNQTWDERPAVADTAIALGEGVADAPYLETLREALPPVLDGHRPGLVYYLAGVDPAADDTYGDARLSAEGIFQRDRFVMESVARLGRSIPLVITLSGGYGGGAWRYSARFLAWLLSGSEQELPHDVNVSLTRVRWLEAGSDPGLGRRGSGAEDGGQASAGGKGWLDWSLDEEDLRAVGPPTAPETRLLGRYGPAEIEAALERFGVLEQIRVRGYPTPTIETRASSGFGPTVRVWGEPERRHLLVELRARVDEDMVPGARVLLIEWLLLQDPRAAFPSGLPPLPGQEHPGLGVFSDVVAWLSTLCEELGLDALGFRSSHFHIAVLARRHLRFLRQEDELRYRLISDQVRDLPLGEAARRVAAGALRDPATGEELRWVDTPMIVPVGARIRSVLRRGSGAP